MDQKPIKCPSCGREREPADGVCECGYEEALEQESIVYKPHNAITARLDAVQGSSEFKATTGEIWGLDADDVQAFILQAERKFRLKRKNHGFIQKNEIHSSTASILKRYVNDTLDFKSFVESFMQNIKIEAALNRKKPAGGSIVFIHYHIDNESESMGRLFVIMVDNNSVFKFDDKLVPEKLPSIDMDALRQAVLVDLTLFDASYPTNEVDPYLQFITGKSNSQFFQKAIGCLDDLDNNRSVNEADRAVKDFITHMKLNAVEKMKVLRSVEKLMHDKLKSKSNNKLTTRDIERRIDDVLDENSPAKGKFSKFAAIGEYKINEYFEPSRTSESKFGKVELLDDEKDYSCSISIQAISTQESPSAKAVYKRDEGVLVIKLSEHDVIKMDNIFS